ncbi:MAG: insulinase family protein, partial [Planctomycetota bacterium]|nr:insulinase family protein [Planctomycetota bacterium]
AIESLRAATGPDQRVRDVLLPRLAPESLLGSRYPLGDSESIRKLSRDDLLAYYRQRYTPSAATILVAGDVDPRAALAMIQKSFAPLPPGPPAEPAHPRIKPYEKPFALVASDPEITGCTVEIGRMDKPRAAITTLADLRRDTVNRLALSAFQRRLERRVERGEAPYVAPDAWSVGLFSAATYSYVRVDGPADACGDIIFDVTRELERVRRHGFSDQDLEDASRALLARSRREARVEEGLDSAAVLHRMSRTVGHGDTLLSESQLLSLRERFLHDIKPAELTEALSRLIDPRRSVYIAILGDTEDAPDERRILEVASAAANADVPALPRRERPDALMADAPKPGAVVDAALDAPSGVLSVWLDNNIRIHHRRMTRRPGEVAVVVTVAGGRLQEDEQTHGFTDASTVVFDRPAAKSRTSTEIRDLLLSADLEFSSSMTSDAIHFHIRGGVDDLEAGLKTAHLLLTEPRVEEPALRRWRLEESRAVARRSGEPGAMLSEIIPRLLPQPDIRILPLT